MIVHIANRALTTGADAWIHALVAQAGLVQGTIGVQNTLWTTTHVRIALKLRQTRANTVVASGVRTTGRWIARVFGYQYSGYNRETIR